jgi:hypothetical protein
VTDLLENGVKLRYQGPATIHRVGEVTLHRRSGGIGAMVWELLVAAGWVGEQTSPRMTVAIRVGVRCAAASASGAEPGAVGAAPLRRREGGWIDEEGIAWQQVVGPLSGRAAGPGFCLLEGALTPAERDQGDALMRAAAELAGWLHGDTGETVELPDVRVLVSVARRNPRWEDPDEFPPAAIDEDQLASMLSDEELLAIALEVADRFGDPEPVVIEHARGTRFDLTRVTGSYVFDDTPSCIFAMEGSFRWSHSRPALHQPLTEADISYRFLTVVIDARTGKPMDHGARNNALVDLTPLGKVVIDRPRQPPEAQ